MFYKARIGGLNELWNDFHSELTLPQPDPIWTQDCNPTVVQQCFDFMHWSRCKAESIAISNHCECRRLGDR